MALISLFSASRAPTFETEDGIISFEAILEDTLEASVEYTSFPLEIGSNASDHGIVMPITWRITGLASNNPLGFSAENIAAGAVSNFLGGAAGAVLGLTAGFMAGSKETNAGATLQMLLALMYKREPFNIDAVDIQLENMVIVNITRTKTAENENGLEFVAELQELPLISTAISSNQPNQSKLFGADPSITAATALISKGEIAVKSVTSSISKAASLLW